MAGAVGENHSEFKQVKCSSNRRDTYLNRATQDKNFKQFLVCSHCDNSNACKTAAIINI